MTVVRAVDDAALLDLVRSAVATVMELPVERLEAGTRLIDDVEADSLAMIEIVEILEEDLRAKGIDVRVDDAALARMQTLEDVVAVVVSAMVSAPRSGDRF
jgi:acyl carrier protein